MPTNSLVCNCRAPPTLPVRPFDYQVKVASVPLVGDIFTVVKNFFRCPTLPLCHYIRLRFYAATLLLQKFEFIALVALRSLAGLRCCLRRNNVTRPATDEIFEAISSQNLSTFLQKHMWRIRVGGGGLTQFSIGDPTRVICCTVLRVKFPVGLRKSHLLRSPTTVGFLIILIVGAVASLLPGINWIKQNPSFAVSIWFCRRRRHFVEKEGVVFWFSISFAKIFARRGYRCV